MNETSEREQDAAVIAKSAQRHADLRALTTLRCVRIEETALLVRVANAGADLIQAQHRERGRLTAERDAAHEKIEQLYASTVSQGVHDKMVDLYNDAIGERDAARDKINAIVAWAESCDESANNPDVDADVAYDRKESVRDIYRLLGIESEASE